MTSCGMAMGDEFGLLDAKSSEARMEALGRFMDFWAGPRRPEFGEPAEELGKFSLPEPLRRLHEFAGRWPGRPFGDTDFFLVPFACNDRLRRVQHTEVGADGKIMFLAENQGVWNCHTLTTGDDPPVWKTTFQQRKNGKWISRDKLICRSLSSFLTTFVLRELVFGSHVWLCDQDTEERFAAEKGTARAIWVDGEYANGIQNTFYVWDQVLVLKERDNQRTGFSFSANTIDGARFLREHRGPAREITLQDFGKDDDLMNWCLCIFPDGGASLRCFGTEGHADSGPGTFDFPLLNATLVQATYHAIYQLGEYKGDPMISFHLEQGCECSNGCFVPRQVAKGLYERAYENARNVSDEFRAQFVKRWSS
jgi:hypothetical protein